MEGIGHFEPLRHYAEVHLILEPGERGSGLILENQCSDDMLDKNWQRLIMTHLAERKHPGVFDRIGDHRFESDIGGREGTYKAHGGW